VKRGDTAGFDRHSGNNEHGVVLDTVELREKEGLIA
jgi:hypothetical protein